MQVRILLKNIDDEKATKQLIDRKLLFALERISSRVREVIVHLEDESPSSGAFDGLCRIDVDVQPVGNVHVAARAETVFDTVLAATRKLEKALKHEFDRERRSSRIRHEKSKRQFVESLIEDDNA